MRPEYKSKINYPDAEYFKLSEKDTRVATAKMQRSVPPIERIKNVIESVPINTVVDRRNRALIAFTLLIGARDCAIASMKLKHDDPLFPKTNVALGEERTFKVVGLKREHWSTASPIRQIFKNAFEAAGLPYFNPHSFCNTLAVLGEKMCQTPKDFKAWS
ncbi:MAG: integrase/recombinase XerD [Neolewinella sp.]